MPTTVAPGSDRQGGWLTAFRTSGKVFLVGIVLVFVVRHVMGFGVTAGSIANTCHAAPGWLLLAAILYVLSWLPAAALWKTMLTPCNVRVPLSALFTAALCGLIGKYTPGKAGSLLIRAMMLKRYAIKMPVSIVTALCETVILLASGLVIAVGLLPVTVSLDRVRESVHGPAFVMQWATWLWMRPVLTIGAAAVGVIIAVRYAVPHLLARVLRSRVNQTWDSEPFGRLIGNWRFCFVSCGTAALFWGLEGVSLTCVLQATGYESFDVATTIACVGACSLASSIGCFAVFTPGGLGVREWILIESLLCLPGMSAESAVAASILLRVVWLLAEVTTGGVLYVIVFRRGSPRIPDAVATPDRRQAA